MEEGDFDDEHFIRGDDYTTLNILPDNEDFLIQYSYI